jgi:hypothetical protein
MYKFSEALAWVAGVMLPIGETLRGLSTSWDVPLACLDDVFIGVLFLFAAWREVVKETTRDSGGW